ncbi:MAG: RnfABCDGE type electron transport complex subunit G [Desulfuromonadales bacterium]|nr:RnfABCDGE type electron transport complex subunit G [Desulfuromonadales bacterium]
MNGLPRLVLALTLITVGAGLLLSQVESMTRAPIAEQRRLETLRALQTVLPDFDNSPDADTVELAFGTDKKGRELKRTFFRGRQGAEISGVAFSVVAPDGYSGNINMMVGVDAGGTVVGLEILTHAETPGLGDKITHDEFKGQFKGKTLEGSDWRVKKDGGDFDQITGATISPRAVVKAVHQGLQFYREHQQDVLTAERLSQ